MKKTSILFSFLVLLYSGCSGSSSNKDNVKVPETVAKTVSEVINNESCEATYFTSEANDALVSKCIGCHSSGGAASDTAYILSRDSVDGNYKNVSALVDANAENFLLDKGSNTISHGGSVQWTQTSKEYQTVQSWLAYYLGKETCVTPVNESQESSKTIQNINFELQSLQSTLRNASLSLVGRLPDASVNLDVSGDETKLRTILDGYMQEEAFYTRLGEIYNDIFFTDRYLTPLRAEDLVSRDQYPDLRWWDVDYENNNTLKNRARSYVRHGIARAPLELVKYIVKNERPYTEIITADYTMLNAFSAKSYGVIEGAFDPSNVDFNESNRDAFFPGKIPKIPHAGVLTEITWLNVFPNTTTNRNRHRSRKVMDFFLATDILKLGERPLDSDEAQVLNPTLNSSACTTCHDIMDPIAGAFQNWDFNGRLDIEHTYINRDGASWYGDMKLPGASLKEVMPIAEFSNSMSWLAKELIKDDRFALSAVHIMYSGFTGRKVLYKPLDSSESDYQRKLAAYNFQHALFTQIANTFVADNYNLKTVVKEIILSPLYRAVSAENVSNSTILSSVGMGKLLSPKELDRKITAILGEPWVWDRNRPNGRHYLVNSDTYKILYGGINNLSITKRNREPNGIMVNLQMRMANQMSCSVSAYDFTFVDAKQRKFFPYVESSYAPATENNFTIPGEVEAIKKNIQHLHEYILGEKLALNDPEIKRTYDLFESVWREGEANVKSEDEAIQEDDYLNWSCQARSVYLTGEDFNATTQKEVRQDRRYIIRAWSAVMTYLLSDFSFLYEHSGRE
jgi:hypothetical protein